MSFERSGQGIPAEPAPPPTTGADGSSGVSPQLRLQILSTEHWSLLASRSLAWNESFSRASMYLSALAGAIVALALVAQASEFGDSFLLFAMVLLPVVLFIGLATFIRLGAANDHDAICVVGMNRIRHAYLELAPELERYFVMGSHDDVRGVGMTMAVDIHAPQWPHFLAATPVVVAVVNSVVAGVIGALAATALGTLTLVAALIGVIGFAGCLGGQFEYARRQIARGQAQLQPLFPTPANDV